MLGATLSLLFVVMDEELSSASWGWETRGKALFEVTVQSKLQSTRRHSPPDLSVLEGEIAGPDLPPPYLLPSQAWLDCACVKTYSPTENPVFVER